MRRWYGLWGWMMIMVIGFGATGHCFAGRHDQLRVFIKDEGFFEKNIVKPRIYVQNVGYRTIRDFDVYYDFKVRSGKRPVVEQYYLPNGHVCLERISRSDYRVHYRFRNVHLKPGECFPGKDGCVIGIHYTDWSEFNKIDDYSNPVSPEWRPTQRVEAVVISWARRY
jgi:hypothetical protein